MARLNIAMLAQEAQAQEVVEQQSELDVVGQQAEDAIAEATQQQVEIEQTQQAMDETEEVIQEAEEERQVLEQSQAQGGAEPVAMEALQRAVKRFEKRTGVACSVKSMGLESFSSKTTRLQHTKVAMEGAVDYIKKLIKMLMDAIAAVWEKVKAFFEKIWVGAERLAKRAKQVEEAAKAVQGKKAPADAKVTTSSVLNYARKDNKVVEGKDFAEHYIGQTSGTYVVRAMIEGMAKALITDGGFTEILDASKKPDNKDAIIKAAANLSSTDKGGEIKDGLVISHSNNRDLGEYVLKKTVLYKNATWEQLSAGYSKLTSQLVRSEDIKDDLAKEVAPMTPEDSRRVAHQVAGHMSSYSDMRTEQNKIDAELKKILSKAKELEKEKDAPVDQLRVGTGVVRAVIGSMMGTVVSYRSYDINLSKAALDYAAASVKLASGKGAESTGTQVAVV